MRTTLSMFVPLLVVGAVGLGAASTALAVSDFVTPNRAAYCGVAEAGPPLDLICWRPADGLTFGMRRLGRAQRTVDPANRGYYDI